MAIKLVSCSINLDQLQKKLKGNLGIIRIVFWTEQFSVQIREISQAGGG